MAANAQDAASLADVMRLMAGMALSNSHLDADAAALLKALTITTAGNSVKLALSVPESQVEALLQSHSTHKTAARRAARRAVR